jgi:hypothetical protein
MSYFHQQRVNDFNAAAKIFLQEQITYYQKVANFYLLRQRKASVLTSYFFLRLSIIFSPPYPSTRMFKKTPTAVPGFLNRFFLNSIPSCEFTKFSLIILESCPSRIFNLFSFYWETFPRMV